MVETIYLAVIVAIAVYALWLQTRCDHIAIKHNEQVASLQEVQHERNVAVEAKNNAYAEINSLKTIIKRQNDELAGCQVSPHLEQQLQQAENECMSWQERHKAAEGLKQHAELQLRQAEQARKVADQRLVELVKQHEAQDASHLLACKQRDAAKARVHALEEAIVKHRNARGHARCLKNDHELYAAYDPKLVEIDPCDGQSLPELMAGCTAYWLGQLGLADHVPDKMEIVKEDVMS